MKKLIYLLGILLLGGIIFLEVKRNFLSDLKEKEVVNYSVSDKVELPKKIAYLTFDDGPSEVTPEILDVLKKKNVKATFFLVGNEITVEREKIVRRELEEGHSIGVHTYSHEKNKMYSDKTAFFADFDQCSQRIQEVTGVSPSLHRFPWGSNNKYVSPMVDDIMAQLKQKGVISFDWNVSGEDSVAENVPMATIYHNVAKDLEKKNNPIILLHDSNTTKNTAIVLGEIIDMISEKGYEFGTLDNRAEYTFPASWR